MVTENPWMGVTGVDAGNGVVKKGVAGPHGAGIAFVTSAGFRRTPWPV